MKGYWQDVGKSGVVGTHAALFYTGQVLFFTRPEEISHKWSAVDNGLPGDDERNPSDRDVTLSTIIETSGPDAFKPKPVHVDRNPFCAGHAFLPDGSLLVAGGDKKNSKHPGTPLNTEFGLNRLRVFHPGIGKWKTIGVISDSRWYPTCTLLPDGRVFIVSGNLDDMPTYNDQNPTCETIPAGAGGAQFLHFLVEAWPYHSYPFVYVLPSGELFVFIKNCSYFLKSVRDKWNREKWEVTKGPKLGSQNHNQQEIEEPAKHYPNSATSVLLPLLPEDNYLAKVMIIGGSGANIYPQWADNIIPGFDCKSHEIDALNKCYRIGINPESTDSAEWEETEPMKNPRVMPDAVLLPDGNVLVVNGLSKGFAGGNAATGPMLSQHAVKEAEIYDPINNKWQSLAQAKCPRLYHSTALLLPDARVMVAGSDHQNNAFIPINLDGVKKNMAVASGYEYTIEVFTPPYLEGEQLRPVYELLDSKNHMLYGKSFTIKVKDLPSMNKEKLKACLICPSAVTHNNNMSQRYVGLKIKNISGDNLEVEAPPDSNIAPPGYYMLFLVHEGVPSEAKFVQILQDSPIKNAENHPPRDDMALWLRADKGVVADAKNRVYSWSDLSGNGMDVYWTPNAKNSDNVISPEPKQRPPILSLCELNGQAVVRFSLVQRYETQWGGYLESIKPFLPGAGSYTVFIVVHPWPSGQDGPIEKKNNHRRGTPGVLSWGDLGSKTSRKAYVTLRFSPGPRSQNPPDGLWINHLPKYPGRASLVTCWGEKQLGDDSNTPVSLEKAILIETNYNGQQSQIRINSKIQAESELPEGLDIGEGPLIIGRNGNKGDFFRGDVAEIIIYKRMINEEDRERIENYIRNKYALW